METESERKFLIALWEPGKCVTYLKQYHAEVKMADYTTEPADAKLFTQYQALCTKLALLEKTPLNIYLIRMQTHAGYRTIN